MWLSVLSVKRLWCLFDSKQHGLVVQKIKGAEEIRLTVRNEALSPKILNNSNNQTTAMSKIWDVAGASFTPRMNQKLMARVKP
jgi:hypothetical protein